RCVRVDPGSVGADTHDRQVESAVVVQLGECIGNRCIATIQYALVLSGNDVAVVAATGIEAHSRAPMPATKRPNLDWQSARHERNRLPPAQLDNLTEPRPSQQVACA